MLSVSKFGCDSSHFVLLKNIFLLFSCNEKAIQGVFINIHMQSGTTTGKLGLLVNGSKVKNNQVSHSAGLWSKVQAHRTSKR